MKQEKRFIHLFRRYVEKKYTPAEKQELMEYIHSGEYDELLRQLVGERWTLELSGFSEEDAPHPSTGGEDSPEQAQTFRDILQQVKIRQRIVWRRIAVAACVTALLGIGIYYQLSHRQPQEIIAHSNALDKENVFPGSNKALLTLANGKTIVLDSAQIGQLAIQGNSKVMKAGNGILTYSPPETAAGQEPVQYNTLVTPRGGQFQIVLPDGSKVWLNSVSSLRYPTAFGGRYREVEMQGQCYFEIAKDVSKPFKVKIISSHGEEPEVLVLGTRFDIMAYPDEPTLNTALLEGGIQIKQGDKETRLSPGQQEIYDRATHAIAVLPVDTEQAVAWKDGFFEFDNTSLAVIMRQLARWYDIEVDYNKVNDYRLFGGAISRNLPLSEILNMLKGSGIYFKLQGRRLVATAAE